MGALLEVSGLRKSYGARVAVNGVGLTVAAGETYGLLGPNGAGKTTAISMIVGILARDAGEIRVDGRPHGTSTRGTKAMIGYVPQNLALYQELSARRNLRFFGRLQGIPRATAGRAVQDALELTGLADRADEPVSGFSGGMARRLNIAIGLLHRPRLLVLDEPTAGVDPQSRNAILDGVRDLAARGVAVLYTTHYMEEAERVCDRVGIIDHGEMIAEGTRRELVGMVGQSDTLRLSAEGDLAGAVPELTALPFVERATAGEDHLELLVRDARACLPAVLAALGSAGAQVRSVEVREPGLESVFLHLTGRGTRD
ncbi:ABC transporter ATP-binding protein [Spongiactinospora sp. TRM90649]|uniref:ABC transporter ATP-binding protein n=1 Tax=Spongiactinospora sp. TRM90649 TaxID=3031114 RepID=UPI0023F6EAF0|nr:ABC transporter ATP-binding protein [Spongiactinospora sp. TRM90649]MDF5757982.1 ABC transporter ATP-binding protein [Spongiactinospora sp. TRM90649]